MSFVHDITPSDAPALVTPDSTVTYAELVVRIERLARTLRRHRMGTDRVCAIGLERGIDQVVAMGAVLRAGAAFLTVDVDVPERRLAALLRGTDALLTSAGLADRFAGRHRREIRVDDPGLVPAGPLPRTRIPARALAYVSHTSGSTGVPNAVLVEHRGLDAYLRFIVRDYGLGPHTVAVQLAPPGYDASIRDTFAPLLAGGRVVLLPRSTLLRPEEFLDALEAYGVNTVLSATPSFLTPLAGHGAAAERLRGLRLVVTSGESLRPFLASGGRRVIRGRLVNQYGPTECTMTSTRFDVPARPEPSADLVGRPIRDVSVRLLDPDLRAVSDGRVGEVYIGGVGVARGYAFRPGLTADRFVPDPLGAPGSRLYRTGDLARRRPGGDLEYLGRRDRQVKLRGHRVDPGEVEAVLAGHPLVTGAVVTVGTDARQRLYLHAYVSGELAEVTDRELRAYLAETLPPHLMPRRFTRLDRFPTTRTGKLDRAALTDGGR
jgi:D-alanine--poly(phosphoribitol) ligase subunit 1